MDDLFAGVLFGVCLFAAYGIGQWRSKMEVLDRFNTLLSRMDDDMEGSVTEWFNKYKEGDE